MTEPIATVTSVGNVPISATTYNVSNLPVVDQYGNHVGYQRVPIEPTVRQKSLLQYSPTAASNVWYSGPRFCGQASSQPEPGCSYGIRREPISGLLIGIMIIVIGLLVIAIGWAIWRSYQDRPKSGETS